MDVKWILNLIFFWINDYTKNLYVIEEISITILTCTKKVDAYDTSLNLTKFFYSQLGKIIFSGKPVMCWLRYMY
jgi:hypothetical protein